MSIWLKLLALMALVTSAVSAHAGICNKSHPNWDAATKRCPEKPVTLKKREPAQPQPELERKVTEVIVPPPVVAKVPELPRSELVLTSRNRSEIPGQLQFVDGLMVPTCYGFVNVPDVRWVKRPSVVESSTYELRAIPAHGTVNNLKE